MPRNRNSFDRSTATFLAQCCHEACTFRDNNEKISVLGGFVLINEFTSGTVKTPEESGVIIESGDRIVIAFKDSHSPFEWLTDMNMSQTKYPFCPGNKKTHSGLTAIYASCREQIIESLRSLNHAKTLYITGHGIGGALAVLNAVDIVANTSFKNPIMYNFGSPRVGDPKFAETYNRLVKNSIRLVNLYDLMCQLPPVIFRPVQSKAEWRYEHVNKQILIAAQTGNISNNHRLFTYLDSLLHLRP